ncbi:Omp28 family outer membrane lipoprotein [Prevotella falsenii]|uniref:Omp28 family outer membrane lipoprotein n=1 Tax=Prevotella falsenii TaxID=515414 RepID=UPI0004690213|nr:Omp28 family outer membrane lipoprotein [Prevotella falsenii]
MKRIIPLLIAYVAIFFSSCANVDEGDRYIEVESSEAKRAVLVEEFTGQRCINCPEAHEQLAQIQKEYGEDKVIAVCIHASALAVSPLKTKVGEEYYKHWNGDGVPSAIINRSGRMQQVSAWAGIINSELQKPTSVSLSMTNKYDAANRQLSIDVNALSREKFDGKLQVWIIEDGIVAKQLLKGNHVDANYVHNHVFRAAVNGTWGTDIALQENVEAKSNFSIQLDATWNEKNVSIVTFVYNDSGVQQVIKQHVNS